MSEQPQYGLIEPFETEDLAGATPDMAFALGVEWEIFRQKLLAGDRFSDLIHDGNAQRVVRMVERHGRFCEHRPFSPGWAEITVGDYRV
jgi:hypothetical protein